MTLGPICTEYHALVCRPMLIISQLSCRLNMGALSYTLPQPRLAAPCRYCLHSKICENTCQMPLLEASIMHGEVPAFQNLCSVQQSGSP